MGAIGDLAIVNRQTTAAPKDYTVPGAQEVMALAVTAAIDGSGAAGSYLPCLQLLDPAGDVLWTARSASSFSAGQSVDMSWFPRAGGITSTQSAGVTPDWGTYFSASVSVGSGLHLEPDLTFNTGSALLDLTSPSLPTFVSRGVYAVTLWIQSSATWTAGAIAGGRLTFGAPTNYSQRATAAANPSGVIENFPITLVGQADAGAVCSPEFENFDTVARTMFSNQMLVQLIYSY